MFARLLLALALALLLASCGGGDSDGSAEPSPTSGIALDPLSAAAIDLAGRVGGDPDDAQIVAMTSTQWPDSCLGLPEPDEVCAQVVTTGYRLTLELSGETHVYHTDRADNARYAGPADAGPTPSPEVSDSQVPDETLAPVTSAREAMAASLDVPLEEIQILSVTPHEWPDACLDLPEADEVCAQVETPGYAVRLLYESSDSRDECAYHTDESTNIRAGLCRSGGY